MNTGLATTRQFVLILGLLSGFAALAVDMSLPAIPTMAGDFDIGLSTGQQIVGVFIIGIALGQIPAGLISDRVGRLPILYGGLVIFTLAATICAVATTIELMLIARFIQGLAASTCVVVPRAIVRDIASGEEAARLLSAIVIAFTVIPMVAPVFGSYAVTLWGWRSPFIVMAVIGVLLLVGSKAKLSETHRPTREHHPIRQLTLSVGVFFQHGQCILGMLLMMFASAGFMSMIAGSSTLIIDLYAYPVTWFGFIYALNGLSLLCGSLINRRLLKRFDVLAMTGVAAGLIGMAAVQMLLIFWSGPVSFPWFWGGVCLYMFGIGFLLPNATAIVLDPVPGIAGIASSIVGTMQGISAAAGAIVGAFLYDGSADNIALIMGSCGIATACVFLLRRPLLRREPAQLPADASSGI